MQWLSNIAVRRPVFASVLILRAWWRTDEPGPRTPRVRLVRLTRVEAVHKRAA